MWFSHGLPLTLGVNRLLLVCMISPISEAIFKQVRFEGPSKNELMSGLEELRFSGASCANLNVRLWKKSISVHTGVSGAALLSEIHQISKSGSHSLKIYLNQDDVY